MPRVSAICPFYLAEPFMAEAIESVLAQSFSDWELLLVDDGSPDGSRTIAESYASRDPDRIRILQHPERANQGSSAARNLGMAEAGGEYLAFIDADDVWLPAKLAVQVAALDRNPDAVMTFGPAERWYQWPGNRNGSQGDFLVPVAIAGCLPDWLVPPPKLLETYLADESQTPCTCAVLVRRDAALSVGGFEPGFRGLYDDQVFYARLSSRWPVHFTDEPLARYRQHAGSCCGTARARGTEAKERGRFLRWLAQEPGARS